LIGEERQAMLDERFLIDEDGFAFSREDVKSLETTLTAFLDLLDYARESGVGVVRWSQIWHIQAKSGRTLAESLFAANELDRDLRNLAGTRLDRIRCWDDNLTLGRIRCWDDNLTLGPSLSVQCAGSTRELAPTISLCLAEINSRHRTGCLTTDQSDRRGALGVADGAGAIGEVHFLVHPDDAPAFWRSVADFEDFDEQELADLSPLAFPRRNYSAASGRVTGVAS